MRPTAVREPVTQSETLARQALTGMFGAGTEATGHMGQLIGRLQYRARQPRQFRRAGPSPAVRPQALRHATGQAFKLACTEAETKTP